MFQFVKFSFKLEIYITNPNTHINAYQTIVGGGRATNSSHQHRRLSETWRQMKQWKKNYTYIEFGHVQKIRQNVQW